jgi:hypothetical protein
VTAVTGYGELGEENCGRRWIDSFSDTWGRAKESAGAADRGPRGGFRRRIDCVLRSTMRERLYGYLPRRGTA